MNEFKKSTIRSFKDSYEEMVSLLDFKLDLDSVESSAKAKKALEVKKQAFEEAKAAIFSVIEIDRAQNPWAKKAIHKLIDKGRDSINELIESVSRPLNIKEISNNADEIQNAIKAKAVARKDAQEILGYIDDLERRVQDDEVVFKDIEFNEGYPERYANIYEKWGDKEGFSTKAGYDPDIDAVKICPNGTVGEIIEIEGLRIALPKQPPKTKIYKRSNKKSDQFWERQGPPLSLIPKTAKSFEDFIEDEFKRKREGMWFFNNGKPEYVTGAHWFLMTHCRTAAYGGYYYFTKAQQKLLIYAEACWCDQRCYGMIFEKIRRYGATDSLMAFGLCKSITVRDKISGMTSKKDKDAMKNFKRQTHMFANLPFYFKPICKDEKSTTKMEFMSPSTRTTKKNQGKEKVDCSLNTWMNYESTSEDSYDGDALFFYLADEFSKWKKQNGDTIDHFGMVKKSLTKGVRIVGKMFIISTIEKYTGADPDSDEALAGDKYKYLYYNSIPTDRNKNDETRTGLYKIFVSSYEHYEGLIDKYGYPITEDPKVPTKTADGEVVKTGIKTRLQNELESIGSNARARIEFLRKTPIEEKDGFAVADGLCTFDQGKILEQIAFNDSLPKNAHGLTPFIRKGNFKWKGGVKDCGVVEWKDDPEFGRFLITWMPDEELRNVQVKRGKKLLPGNSSLGAFGVDTYRVSQTVDKKGSKGSMHGYLKANPTSAPNNHFFLEYLCRPEKIEIFLEDMIMAMVFYGMPALIENNVLNLLEEMNRRGYSGYSLKRPDKHEKKLSETERLLGGIPTTSEDVREMQSSALESNIDDHVGEIDEDTYGTMYFNRTLYDWMAFDPSNRTKRDASISSSLAIIGATKGKKKSTDTKAQKELIQGLVGRYNNNQTVGRRIGYNNSIPTNTRRVSVGRYRNKGKLGTRIKS